MKDERERCDTRCVVMRWSKSISVIKTVKDVNKENSTWKKRKQQQQQQQQKQRQEGARGIEVIVKGWGLNDFDVYLN